MYDIHRTAHLQGEKETLRERSELGHLYIDGFGSVTTMRRSMRGRITKFCADNIYTFQLN